MILGDERLLGWQRRLDPAVCCRPREAAFHTAPAVVFPGSPDYPSAAPERSVTVMFPLKADFWIAEPRRGIVEGAEFVEKPPRGRARRGPVALLGKTSALCVVPVSANYYYAARELSRHDVVRLELRPSRHAQGEALGPVMCVATFLEGPKGGCGD